MTEQSPETAPAKPSPPGDPMVHVEPALHMAKAWDIKTNPPSNSMKVSISSSTRGYQLNWNLLLSDSCFIFQQGHLVPKVFSRTRRRFCVEVYRFHDPDGGHYDECFVRYVIISSSIRQRYCRAHVFAIQHVNSCHQRKASLARSRRCFSNRIH